MISGDVIQMKEWPFTLISGCNGRRARISRNQRMRNRVALRSHTGGGYSTSWRAGGIPDRGNKALPSMGSLPTARGMVLRAISRKPYWEEARADLADRAQKTGPAMCSPARSSTHS